jgi:hypothetical protein
MLHFLFFQYLQVLRRFELSVKLLVAESWWIPAEVVGSENPASALEKNYSTANYPKLNHDHDKPHPINISPRLAGHTSIPSMQAAPIAA